MSEALTEQDIETLRRGASCAAIAVPGGHMVMWSAFDECARAVETFLG